MLTLKLYPADVHVMYSFLTFALSDQRHLPLYHQTIGAQVLLEYFNTWKYDKLVSWHRKKLNKQYQLSMKLSVVLALKQQMQLMPLSEHQLLFLAKLDQAIVNYRHPGQDAHVIGELIQQAGY